MHSSRFRSGLVLLPAFALAFAVGNGVSSANGADASVPTASDGDVKAKLDQSEEKLSQVLRSYTQAQAESAKLQAALDKARAENSALSAQVKDLTAKVAAAQAGAASSPSAPTPTSTPAASTDAEANLATALRSYALLRDESDQIKAQRDKLATDKAGLESQLAALKGTMSIAAQAEGLREQLRQTQAQSAAFAEENARLKTQLALDGGSVGSLASRSNIVTPVAVATTPDPMPTPTPPPVKPEVRTHTIVAGDTLSKIALKYYGTASRWPEILAANRDTLKSETGLIAGRTLKIP